MKRGTLYTLVVIIVLVVIGGIYFQVNYSKTPYYGQVGKLDHTEKAPKGYPDTDYYEITGYDKNGKAKHLEVGTYGGQKFTKGHYITIFWSKAQGVASYERTYWNKIPKKARVHLPQPNSQ
ncbi:YxeA family protein [Lentilactobacillus parafarraginis]|jgi:uncharacterized protein (TIGR01655 family)|uniref:YxeA family protein n=2 Tax=Lentilactobacillus parafarraginis TaxID=390842 RepID=A0A0R1YQ56_9LACO|nr:YxeA family protein [Lentilactobacillus parafarraginis]KRM44353.1 hypothetical protein FD47_GL000616 [Lentilactobacillus parafarraginis DSM 18390 = JCM 14109]TLQ17382.1 YxeA family protein [Lentilactobacillus parafarraginis]